MPTTQTKNTMAFLFVHKTESRFQNRIICKKMNEKNQKYTFLKTLIFAFLVLCLSCVYMYKSKKTLLKSIFLDINYGEVNLLAKKRYELADKISEKLNQVKNLKMSLSKESDFVEREFFLREISGKNEAWVEIENISKGEWSELSVRYYYDLSLVLNLIL